MTSAPPLFDRHALSVRRARMRDDSLFLHRAALDEAQDRLSMVKRTFTAPAIVTPAPDLWRAALPEAKIVADEDTLALEPGAHDLVIHAMCLHSANDPVGQLIQCRRALKEDGFLLAFLLGGETLNELRAVLGQAETEVTGGLSPRVAPMAEIRDLGALLQRAGLALPVADSLTLTAEYRDLTHLMHDLRAMGEANILANRLRRPTRRGVFARADALYAEHFATPEGRLRASFELVGLTGWAPSDSQPKPLRPGSAQARLADALNTTENPLSD
ncbi:methyltransferase domain-containing protein [Antarcticimicrobium luteum]|uniref:SAM-dependent methyltransferase n=1 Tax=Antarcticimicrobium luteum TaxID=2547397 RepID=A0A4R5UYI7_9RHOB|nr:methyltransferase domain-containing protein [Antarcticimicrobium luteum]TDK44409.1 SAM-dependent methyltransferase [Antarcticimicrobium luteum]